MHSPAAQSVYSASPVVKGILILLHAKTPFHLFMESNKVRSQADPIVGTFNTGLNFAHCSN